MHSTAWIAAGLLPGPARDFPRQREGSRQRPWFDRVRAGRETLECRVHWRPHTTSQGPCPARQSNAARPPGERDGLRNMATIEAANALAPEFIQTWNAKFAAPPQGPVDAQSSVDGALRMRWRINWQGAGNGRCPKPSLSGPAAPCRCIIKTAICQSRPARHSPCPIPPQTKPPSMRASMASSPANLRRLRQAQGWILEQKACIAAARCRRARRCPSKSMETGARHQFLFTQKGYFPAVPKEASGLAHART